MVTKTKKSSLVNDFTSGSLTSHIIRFGIPVLLSHLMMVLLNTVDMIVVGMRLGEAGTSAVSIGGSVAMFLNAFIGGFATATQVLIAIMIGSGQRERISRFVTTVCGFIFASAIVSMLVMLPLTDVMLKLLNTPPEAYKGAFEYSRICLYGIIPIYAYHIISAVVRGLGNSKHPLLFITIACGLNIVLDVVFVLLLDMGVGGAALATVIAQLVSVIFSVGLLVKKRESFGLSIKMRDFVSWDRNELGGFLKLAIPMALNNSCVQIAIMAVNSLTNDFGVSVSAFAGIRANILTTVDLILGSFAAAGATVIGQNIASGNIKRVKGALLRIGIITVSISLALSLVFIFFPVGTLRIFTSEADVLAIAKPHLPIFILSFIGAGLRPIARSLIDGSGNRKINLVIAILSIVFRIGLAVLFGIAFNFGYMGFWFGTTVAELVPVFVGLVFYLSGKWKRVAIDKKRKNKGFCPY